MNSHDVFCLTRVQQLYSAGIPLLEAYLLPMANNRTRKERLSQNKMAASNVVQIHTNAGFPRSKKWPTYHVVGLGGLCSIFHPLCYSNMLEIIPIMLETMPQVCLLCSNYAHNFSYSYIDHVLIPYLSRELHEALLLGAGCHRPQGRPQACIGPCWGIVGRNMYFCTVMYRSLSVRVWTTSTSLPRSQTLCSKVPIIPA